VIDVGDDGDVADLLAHAVSLQARLAEAAGTLSKIC
jgi:hypothetical protein